MLDRDWFCVRLFVMVIELCSQIIPELVEGNFPSTNSDHTQRAITTLLHPVLKSHINSSNSLFVCQVPIFYLSCGRILEKSGTENAFTFQYFSHRSKTQWSVTKAKTFSSNLIGCFIFVYSHWLKKKKMRFGA